MRDIFSFFTLMASPILASPTCTSEEDVKLTREQFLGTKMWFENYEISMNQIDRMEFSRAQSLKELLFLVHKDDESNCVSM